MNIYKQALGVQDAVNPRGVLKSFAEEIMPAIVEEVIAETGYASTDDICKHPVFVLFCSKLESLAGYGGRFSEAYRICNEKAGQP